MHTIQLYVTEWAPNGTNDLLVVKDGEIVDCIHEATFGIDVCKLKNQAAIGEGTNWLYDPSDCDPRETTLVGEVSVAEVRAKIAACPGRDAKEFDRILAKALIKAA